VAAIIEWWWIETTLNPGGVPLSATSLLMETTIALVPPILDVPTGILCLFVLAFVPHVYKGTLIAAASGKYKNSNPRGQFEQVTEKLKNDARSDDKILKASSTAMLNAIQRALAAHNNSLEFLMYFGLAAITASVFQVPAELVSSVVTLACASRVLYIVIYLSGTNEIMGLFRSAVWGVGLSCAGLLLILASTHSNGTLSRL
jgi:uncharacterized MAPEG superfamily protein